MSKAPRKLRQSGIVLFVPRSVRRALPYHLKKNRELFCARVRAGGSVGSPDYMKMLLPSKESERPRSEDCLLANANVYIVAGFDPLTSLTAVVHYMLVGREQYRRLTDEVGAFSAYDPITNQELQSLRYLYSVLEEGLRLHTPAEFGLPPRRAIVDGRWIPRGVGSPPISLLPNKNQLTLSLPSLPDNGTDSLLLHDTFGAIILSSAGFHPEGWLPSPPALYDAKFASDTRSAFRSFGMGP
jgi:Cytochrome P450